MFNFLLQLKGHFRTIPPVRKNGLLWKISGKKIVAPLYIFGTMHARDSRIFSQLPQLKAHILECEAFATEFNFDEINDQTLPPSVFELPDKQTLRDLLTDKQYNRLAAFMQAHFDLDVRQFNRRKPMMISNFIASAELSEEQDSFLDMALFQFAKSEKKLLLGIETLDEQVQILNRVSLKKQVSSLMDTIEQHQEHQTEMQKLTSAYQIGDLDEICRITSQTYRQVRTILITERNKLMTKRIRQIAGAVSLFVAVCAAHLGGEKGILSRLEAKGYSVEPVVL